MKKKILALIIMAAIAISSLGGMTAFAYVSMEECDRCFQTTMNALLNRDEVEGDSITAERKPVYDLFLEQLGYVYEYELADGEGYAIIICDDGNYVAIEVMPHSQSPYASVPETELCVYVNNMSYYKSSDGKIFSVQTGAEITEEEYTVLKENAIVYKSSGTTDPEYVTVRINYTSFEYADLYGMEFRTPQYCAVGHTNACAATAGGNVIGYFDRYYEDLIPNHEAGKYVSGYYLYNASDTSVYQAIDTLYVDMQATSEGITENNFKSGLKAYCSRKGLSCDYTSLMSWGSLNYNSVKSSMKNNRPVVLFLNTYNICDTDMFNDRNEHYIRYTNYFGNHVMVGFGYRDLSYVLTDGSNSSYRFIYVATGFANPGDAYFNIDYSTNIVSAYGVNIY